MSDDETRDALIQTAGDWDKRASASESWMPGLIDALLPVVRRAQAAALRDAADEADDGSAAGAFYAMRLRARADRTEARQ